MAELKYRTRNQVSPAHKPRVYVACHRQDHSRYFEDICSRILKLADCAIYYYDPNEDVVQDENYFMDLGLMQLMVMAVSRQLLESENRAMDVEFPYALQHKKPVLPLLYESGIEALFNARCGDLQCLEPNSQDNTALRFEDKLKQYLDSVLLTDALRQQLRDAFDASIFLSYRKKDRRYARELMGLIHREPKCRDVAIWYDEFLVPGENFNDSIEKALLQSQAFALVVTPNLLEPGNYVMTTEYKMAVKHQKNILPVKMLDTDPAALEACYENLPRVVDGHDKESVSLQLLLELQDVKLLKNDGDPTHDFLIGLAYLNGLDVEVDTSLGVSLIRRAAEAGSTQAMQKLAAMYHSGEGVDRDYRHEAYWLEKVVKSAETAYAQAPALETALVLMECLNHVRWAWYTLKETDKTFAVCEKLLSIAKHWFRETQDRVAGYAILQATLGLGDLCFEAGQTEQAEKYYTEAHELIHLHHSIQLATRDIPIVYGRLAVIAKTNRAYSRAESLYGTVLKQRQLILEQNNTLETQRDLAISYDELGDVVRLQSKYEAALEYFVKALELRQALAAADTEGIGPELCASYFNVGNAYMNLGRLREAKTCFLQALELAEQFDSTCLTAQEQYLLGCIHHSLSQLYTKADEPEAAALSIQKGIAILEDLAERTPLAQHQVILSEALLTQADLHLEHNAPQQAYACCQRVTAIAQALQDKTALPEAAILLLRSAGYQAQVLEAQDDPEGAKQILLDVLGCRTDNEEDVRLWELLTEQYMALKRISEKLGDLKAAQQYAMEAISLTQQTTEITATSHSLLLLALLYKEYAQLCALLEQLPAAAEAYEQTCEICERLEEESPSIEAALVSLNAGSQLGQLLLQLGDLENAMLWSGRSVHVGEELLEFAEGAAVSQMQGLLADNYRNLAGILQAQGNSQHAKSFYVSAVNAYAQSITGETMESAIPSLHTCAVRLAKLHEQEGDLEQAKEYYVYGIEALTMLAQQTQQDNLVSILSSNYHSVGLLCMKLEQPEDAQEYFTHALMADIQLAKQNPTQKNLQNLAADHTKLGDIALDLEDTAVAESHYADALRIDRAIAQQVPDIYTYAALASSCLRMGALKSDRLLLEESLDLCDWLIAHSPDDQRFMMLREQIEECLSDIQ